MAGSNDSTTSDDFLMTPYGFPVTQAPPYIETYEVYPESPTSPPAPSASTGTAVLPPQTLLPTNETAVATFDDPGTLGNVALAFAGFDGFEIFAPPSNVFSDAGVVVAPDNSAVLSLNLISPTPFTVNVTVAMFDAGNSSKLTVYINKHGDRVLHDAEISSTSPVTLSMQVLGGDVAAGGNAIYLKNNDKHNFVVSAVQITAVGMEATYFWQMTGQGNVPVGGGNSQSETQTTGSPTPSPRPIPLPSRSEPRLAARSTCRTLLGASARN